MQIDKALPGVKKNILLKNYTTFRIGGKAKYFFVAKNKEDLIAAIKLAKKLKLPFFVLGGGSNILVSDKGFNGLVIKIENCKLKIENCKLSAESGVPLGKLVNISVEKSLTGLEWAVGIPGTVGGAIYGNAGAFKKSMKGIAREVEAFDAKDLRFKIYDLRKCRFSYRDSVFKKNKNLIILSAVLQLRKGKKSEIKKEIEENLKARAEKQPLNFPSVGSIFKNPPGFLSFAAARLIEECGLKGKRVGNVKISEKHANFIVNLGGGRAKDVMRLIKIIKNRVKNKFGVILEEEIQFLGF